MPSHIDIRRGRWQEAVESNTLAINADRTYQKVVPEQGFYRLYMAHNHHMLTFAAMMQGQSALAMKYIREMGAGVPKEWLAIKENAAIVDGFLAMPLEVQKRFGKWDDILKEPEPPELFPIARAMRRHTRGVALAAQGKVAEARDEQKMLREGMKKVAPEAIFANNKAADLFAIADDMLEGEILLREGKLKEAIAALCAAGARRQAALLGTAGLVCPNAACARRSPPQGQAGQGGRGRVPRGFAPLAGKRLVAPRPGRKLGGAGKEGGSGRGAEALRLRLEAR